MGTPDLGHTASLPHMMEQSDCTGETWSPENEIFMDIDDDFRIYFDFLLGEEDDIGYQIPLHGQEQEPPRTDYLQFVPAPKQLGPELGMEFDSLESAKKFYYEYAERSGFRARAGRCRTSLRDDSVIMKQFTCYKEGFSVKKKRPGKKTRNRLSIREGCKAMIQLNRRGHDRWVVSKFIPEHTHTLVITVKAQKTKKKRQVPEIPTEMRWMFQDISQGLSDEAENYSVLGDGEPSGLLEYLKRQQTKNPAFFYSIQVDDNDRLTTVFWASANSRAAYGYFGDVVTFDTTYKKNKHMVPFAPFVGVNHHLQLVVFGCALLLDDTEASFSWLFETFLVAMCGCHPVSLVTDYNGALKMSAAKVFPNTCHRFCKWQILSKCKEKLPELCSAPATRIVFKYDLRKCMDELETVEEFESSWQVILAKYNLWNNIWMQSLYEVRHQWANVYLKDTFFAEISPAQRYETMNKFFQRNFETEATLKEFIVKFDEAMSVQSEKEVKADFANMYSGPVLKTTLYIEKQAAATYTKTMFTIFQKELIQSSDYKADKIEDGTSLKYRVAFEGNDSHKSYTVAYNADEMPLSCDCRMFEFSGILCRHVLRVLAAFGFEKLPEFYFLKRWKKIAKNCAIQCGSATRNQQNDPTNLASRCNDLYLDIIKYAEHGASSGVIYKVAKEALCKAFSEVVSARKALCSLGHGKVNRIWLC